MHRLRALLPHLVLFTALIALWAAAIDLLKVPTWMVPSPGAVLAALRTGLVDGAYWPHIGATVSAIVSGYFIGCSLAFLVAIAFVEWALLERLLTPYVIALQSMPKVALAPLIIVWFGFGLASKVAMVALICFFPMFINTVIGLRAADPSLIDLMRAYSASRAAILWRIKVPSGAGHIFAGLQIGLVLSLIGAVVAEFVSSNRGLGYLINQAAVSMATDTMFAGIACLVVLGLAGSSGMRFLHRRIVFWDKRSAPVISE
jgi:NitT/TauT family transport system permease protein